MGASKSDEQTSVDGVPLLPRPKTLGPAPPVLPSSPPETVPARMVNEALYCERLMYLEWAQGEFAHNAYTADGAAVHARVDQPRAMPATRATSASALSSLGREVR